jgi:hypothetical protein
MRKPQNIQVLKRKVDGVDDQCFLEHCVDAGVGTEGASSDDGRGWLMVVTARRMATMTAMAATAMMASTTTMIKTRRFVDTGRRCVSDSCHGTGGVGDGDMDATLVISTMIEGNMIHTSSKSLLTYPGLTGSVSNAWTE